MSSLRVLKLSENFLKVFPDHYSLIKGIRWDLRSLTGYDPLVPEILAPIWRLKNLEELDLTRARLRVLPAEIGTLTKLKRLYLGKNALKKLPEEIGNLKELEILDLTGNLLDEIPSQVVNLPRLKELGLEDNLKMLEVPKRMKKMETY